LVDGRRNSWFRVEELLELRWCQQKAFFAR
jgi:hypothetical protein